MNVAIIDYGSGNLHSAAKAFERAAIDNAIAAKIAVVSKAESLRAADRIVLPASAPFAIAAMVFTPLTACAKRSRKK